MGFASSRHLPHQVSHTTWLGALRNPEKTVKTVSAWSLNITSKISRHLIFTKFRPKTGYPQLRWSEFPPFGLGAHPALLHKSTSYSAVGYKLFFIPCVSVGRFLICTYVIRKIKCDNKFYIYIYVIAGSSHMVDSQHFHVLLNIPSSNRKPAV